MVPCLHKSLLSVVIQGNSIVVLFNSLLAELPAISDSYNSFCFYIPVYTIIDCLKMVGWELIGATKVQEKRTMCSYTSIM